MKFRKMNWTVIAALLVCVPAIHSQDQPQNSQSVSPTSPIAPIAPTAVEGGSGSGKRPAPAARGVSPDFTPTPNDFTQVEPDTHTLASIEDSGIGSLQHVHDIFDPSILFSQGLLTGVQGSGGQTGDSSISIFSGRINLIRNWSRYKLSAVYDGGESFYVPKVQNNPYYQGLSLSQEMNWDRWLVRINYDFLASPQADFGGQGMGGPGLLGGLVPTATNSTSTGGSSFIPGETILTSQSMRLRNVVLGEVNYAWSRRSRFTFAGSYGLLHFMDPGYIDSHSLFGQAGYEYSLDTRNTIGINGGYGRTEFSGSNAFADNYMAQLAYGRKVTGRFAVQLAGGPEQIRLGNVAPGNLQLWTWAFHGGGTYATRRSLASVSYTHGLSSGSGVLLGATSHTFSGSVTHQFTRLWSGIVNSGYALSSALAPAAGVPDSFSTWYGGAGIGRQVGRHMAINFNYGIQDQKNGSICPVAVCGPAGVQQSAGVTVNWHLRQVE